MLEGNEITQRIRFMDISNLLGNKDLGRAVAGYKFYELSNIFNAAIYSLQEVKKQESLNLKFYSLKHAILEFNSCYDYCIQIVYFAFDFFEKIESARDYKKCIKNCRKKSWRENELGQNVYEDSQFYQDILRLKKENASAKAFFEKFEGYLNGNSNEKYGISSFTNNIKHQGGFWIKELLPPNKGSYIKCFKMGKEIFTTEWLYPFQYSVEQIMARLNWQRSNINELASWLFKYIYGDSIGIINHKQFSANRCMQDLDFDFVLP